MNRKLIFLTITLLVSTLVAACAPAATPAPGDPLAIVKLYYTNINTNDVDQAMQFVAEDVVITDPSRVIEGKAAVTNYWKELAAAGFRFELSELKATQGRVTSCYQVFQNAEKLDEGCNGVTLVKNGKIIFDGLVPAENVYVVQRYYAAVNAKDTDKAMSYLASNAVFANPTGKYTTPAEIRASLDGLAKDGISFELSNFSEQAGRVVYDYKVLMGSDVLDSGTDGLTIVQDGLIVFDGTERTE